MKILTSMLLLLVITTAAYAAEVDGKWTGTISGPAGELPLTFNLKADGAKLTGSTLGFDGSDVAIKDGKIDGNNIAFTVTLDFGGMPFTISYKGVLATDQLKMTGEAAGMPFEFVLKKEKAEK